MYTELPTKDITSETTVVNLLYIFLYTVQTGTGKVDPARKFKCTTAVRVI